MNKKRIIILSCLIFIVLITLIGFTFAYFTARVGGNTKEKSVEISAATLDLEYQDGNNEIIANKIFPGTTIATKTFSVINTGTGNVKNYVVYLENIINEINNKSDLVYNLTCESIKTTTKNPVDTCKGVNETIFPYTDRFIVTNDIDIGITHYYTLTVKYKETEENQSLDMGKTISAKVNIYDFRELNNEGLKLTSAKIYGNTTFSNTPSLSSPATLLSLGESSSSINVISKTKNLFTNGYGEKLNNTNFSQFIFSNDSPSTDMKGSFTSKRDKYKVITSDELIPIDTSLSYNYSMYLKNTGNLDTKYYVGFEEFDIDNNYIKASNVMYINNTLTYLTNELNDGDTVVHLDNIDNFKNSGIINKEQLGFIFWNYKDSTGYEYEPLTYSRNVYTNIYTFENIDKTNKTITLNEPWNNGKIESGTKLSQSNSSSGYNYSICSNCSLTNSWKKYSKTISGVNTKYNVDFSKFRAGTKYIKLLVLDDFNSVANSNINIAGISLTTDSDTQTNINLNNIDPLRCVKDVCDYIDLNKNQIVRQVGKLVLPTNIHYVHLINTNTNYASIFTPLSYLHLDEKKEMNENNIDEVIYSTHIPYLKSSLPNYKYEDRTEVGIMGYQDATAAFMITALASDFPNKESWTQFLINQQTNGTPFTIFYKLKNPYTENISVPNSISLTKSQEQLEACDESTCGSVDEIIYSK